MKKPITIFLKRTRKEKNGHALRSLGEEGGFTLLEMIVSMGLFSVLVVAVVGIMLQVSKVQAKVANIQSVQDNIRFGMELFAKEIRTGTGYRRIATCGSLGSGLTFVNFNQGQGRTRFYYLADTDADLNPDTIMRIALDNIDALDCSKAIPFTAEDIRVKNLVFSVAGENPGPEDGQPHVTISMEVEAKNPKLGAETQMSIQTTIVQRLRDF